MIYISEMKRSGQRQYTWTADINWNSWSIILSSNWSVSLKLCSDCWFKPFKRRISRLWQTNRQTNRQINLIDCWTASFAVKKMKEIHRVKEKDLKTEEFRLKLDNWWEHFVLHYSGRVTLYYLLNCLKIYHYYHYLLFFICVCKKLICNETV